MKKKLDVICRFCKKISLTLINQNPFDKYYIISLNVKGMFVLSPYILHVHTQQFLCIIFDETMMENKFKILWTMTWLVAWTRFFDIWLLMLLVLSFSTLYIYMTRLTDPCHHTAKHTKNCKYGLWHRIVLLNVTFINILKWWWWNISSKNIFSSTRCKVSK